MTTTFDYKKVYTTSANLENDLAKLSGTEWDAIAFVPVWSQYNYVLGYDIVCKKKVKEPREKPWNADNNW